tara:strand:+ start:6433 stop:7692 length:1260 start_codon:yes stop_codon:yes gene_type:complete
MENKKNLMIVCHPDDEVLWGSELLLEEQKYNLIVLTNESNISRKSKFLKILKIFNQQGKMYDFNDNGLEWSIETISKIKDLIANNINSYDYEKIITHNPDGEYGHVCHVQISNLIHSIIKEKEKLFYFNFNDKEITLSRKTTKALKVYFGNFYFRYHFYKSISNIIDFVSGNRITDYFTSLLGSKFNTIKGNFTECKLTLQHINLSKHQSIVSCQLYKSNISLIRKIYKEPYLLYEREDVYKYYDDLYRTYSARDFLVKKHLPECESKVLSVGCHHFNRWDHLLIKNPELYYTIDLEKEFQQYGSPYNHETIDFLDYQPKLKFSSIVLFGVMGIPSSNNNFNKYSLYKNDNKVIEKMDSLLKKGGTVFFGPDYVIDQSVDGIAYWDMFFSSNEILKSNYKLESNFEGTCNLVYVFKKIK